MVRVECYMMMEDGRKEKTTTYYIENGFDVEVEDLRVAVKNNLYAKFGFVNKQGIFIVLAASWCCEVRKENIYA